MKQEFKSYNWESKEYIPPIISEKKAALKSWLNEKITRISMNKGSINSGFNLLNEV